MISYAQAEVVRHTCGHELHKAKYRRTEVSDRVRAREKKVTRKLHDVMAFWAERWAKKAKEEMGEVGKASSKTKQTTDIILSSLNVQEFTEELVDELSPEVRSMFRQAAKRGVRQVGFKATKEIVQHTDAAAVRYSERRSAELIEDLARTTRENLRLVISSAVEEGRSADELADNIEEAFAFSESRARTIARTELASAHVQGNVEGWRETKEVEGKQSILGDLHPQEDECDENAEAGTIPLDDDFPSGQPFPPYHPNCMCDVVPVLKDEDD